MAVGRGFENMVGSLVAAKLDAKTGKLCERFGLCLMTLSAANCGEFFSDFSSRAVHGALGSVRWTRSLNAG